MSKIPSDLRYTDNHEWVRKEKDGTYTVGLTDHAQNLLGDLVFVELPTVEMIVKSSEECCTVESVKSASDVFAPLSGIITDINTALESSPELVNKDPYGKGWLFRIEPSNPEEFTQLLTAEDYEKQAAQ